MTTSSLSKTEFLNEVGKFVSERIAPLSREIDERNEFPKLLYKEMGEKGILGVTVPKKYGGRNYGFPIYLKVVERVARESSAVAASIATHEMLTYILLKHGTEKQKEKYLTSLVNGEMVGGFAMTEPWAGSDVNSISTSAEIREDTIIIDGVKKFISNGTFGDLFGVVVKTGELGKGRAELSFVLVEKKDPGFKMEEKLDLSGNRGLGVAKLVFNNCEVEKGKLVGEKGEGFKIIMDALLLGKLSYAAIALGLMEEAVNLCLSYTRERKQFNQPLFNFQAVNFTIAEMATEFEASKALLEKVASKWGRDENLNFYASVAKLFITGKACETALKAVQLHGGRGYLRGEKVEKLYRDAKGLEIGEGTSEIQKRIIARELSKMGMV